MLKKPTSFVLARHSRLTVSAAFTNVPPLIRRGVNLRDSTYGKEYASSLHSLRPCMRRGVSWHAGAGWVRSVIFLNILKGNG